MISKSKHCSSVEYNSLACGKYDGGVLKVSSLWSVLAGANQLMSFPGIGCPIVIGVGGLCPIGGAYGCCLISLVSLFLSITIQEPSGRIKMP